MGKQTYRDKERECRVCRRMFKPTGPNQQRCIKCIEANKRYAGRRSKSHPVKIKEEYGDLCWICGRKLSIGTPGWAAWVRHHLSYEPEVIALLCKSCHGWLHGQVPAYQHAFKKKYGKELAPYIFAKRVVWLYEDHVPNIHKCGDVSFDELLHFLRNSMDYLTDEEISTIKLEAELKRKYEEKK